MPKIVHLNLGEQFYKDFFSVKGLSDAIQEFIEKDEKDAISELVNFQVNKIQVRLITKTTRNKQKQSLMLFIISKELHQDKSEMFQ